MRTFIRWLLVALAVVFLYRALRYAQGHQRAVDGLPARVARELAREKAPFVPLSRIPKFLQEAIVATEDQSFWTNWGISLEGIARSLVVDILSGRFVEGGSTITQELARDQFLTPEKTIQRKLREILLALMITHTFSKSEILALYLNQVYFGAGATGIYQASRVYFGRPPWELTRAQCSLLAGLPQAPSVLDPLVHLSLAKARQWEVLASMVRLHYLTPRDALQIYRAPLDLVRRGRHRV